MRAAPERRTVVDVACLALAVVCCACSCSAAALVELRGQDPRLVAASWLRTQGLASTGEASR